MEYNQPEHISSNSRAVEFDAGLRAYMLSVYNYMASALALTGIVAWFASKSEAWLGLMSTPLSYVIMFAPLGVVIYLSVRLNKLSEKAAQGWFWAFATIMGLSLYSIFMIYSGTSIARVFFITAGTFGAMSIYGYTTKRDLTGMGSFLIMGVFGLIIASIVNIFMQSSALQFGISVIGVLVFVGLTAYDTQKIKNMYYAVAGNAEARSKAIIMGALSLYLDFINLFLMLLNLLGSRD